jgi:predicted DsbA family dithiol-disulfide isomerase
VRADEGQARSLGIGGVPFFVLGGRHAVSGAQPSEVLLRAMTEAWNAIEAGPDQLAQGAACDAGGCELP